MSLVKAHIKSRSETDRSNASFRLPGSNQNYNSCESDIYGIVKKKIKGNILMCVFMSFPVKCIISHFRSESKQ